MSFYSIAIVSFLICFLFTPIIKTFGERLGILDQPGDLSIHVNPVPRIGGLAIYLGLLAGLGISLMGYIPDILINDSTLIHLSIGITIFGIVGLLGDINQIPSKLELAFQFVPAVYLVSTGIIVRTLPIKTVAILVSVLYIVGGASSMNLLDGMDGLAAGISAIASLFLGVAAVILANQFAAVTAFALMGGCLGFIYYNFHPAKLFMGDVGSLLLGSTLAVIGICMANQTFAWRTLLGPIIILGVPVIDTFTAIIRRLTRDGEIVSGDRDHLYDRIHQYGFSMKATVLIMYGVGLLFGLIGLLITVGIV